MFGNVNRAAKSLRPRPHPPLASKFARCMKRMRMLFFLQDPEFMSGRVTVFLFSERQDQSFVPVAALIKGTFSGKPDNESMFRKKC